MLILHSNSVSVNFLLSLCGFEFSSLLNPFLVFPVFHGLPVTSCSCALERKQVLKTALPSLLENGPIQTSIPSWHSNDCKVNIKNWHTMHSTVFLTGRSVTICRLSASGWSEDMFLGCGRREGFDEKKNLPKDLPLVLNRFRCCR